ncbi:MAG: hypothetical protein NE327_21440, partial [Lentisphaeraceae bacterium]|nr:hypothetical protein [Lentisphaeraceae bacterium]
MKQLLILVLLCASLTVSAADNGSLISTAVKINGDTAARSHIVTFDGASKNGIVFDSDTMRMTGAWIDGKIEYKGLPFTGAHGPYPEIKGKPLFHTKPGPGFAKDGSFADPRVGDKPKLGNLPKSWSKFLGIYRKDSSIVFNYSVGSVKVLDYPSFANGVITRTIQTTGSGELKMAVAAGNGEANGKTATVGDCGFSTTDGSFS